jgi:hypothetical protein
MPTFPVRCGPFAGMTEAQLLVLQTQAQTALTEVMLGSKNVTLSYASGDGNKSVTRQMTSVQNVQMFLMMVQQALGTGGRRSPLRPVYAP